MQKGRELSEVHASGESRWPVIRNRGQNEKNYCFGCVCFVFLFFWKLFGKILLDFVFASFLKKSCWFMNSVNWRFT